MTRMIVGNVRKNPKRYKNLVCGCGSNSNSISVSTFSTGIKCYSVEGFQLSVESNYSIALVLHCYGL